MTSAMESGGPAAAPRWQPIAAIDRRVLGVLAEKAKTTPDAYPLSLNALVTGCNQKNNRHPLSQYELEDVEASLERLRHLGAVAAVQGGGRVEKYRHYLYEWLGVDKLELAVMTELLLRGAQTEGELRGRAARMDPIPDLSTLRPVMESLKAKGLVQAVTSEGRGQIVTHTLYLPEEMEKLRRQHGDAPAARAHIAPSDEEPEDRAPRQRPAAAPRVEPAATRSSSAPVASANSDLAALRREVEDLRSSVAQLRSDMADLATQSQRNTDDLDRLRSSLGE
jgi:uncharacterized protein